MRKSLKIFASFLLIYEPLAYWVLSSGFYENSTLFIVMFSPIIFMSIYLLWEKQLVAFINKTNKIKRHTSTPLSFAYKSVKIAWCWFAALFIPIYSFIVTYTSVVPKERMSAYVVCLILLEIIYMLMFLFVMLAIRVYAYFAGKLLDTKKNERDKQHSGWIIVSMIASLAVIFATAQIEKHKITKEATYYNVPTKNMGIVSDGFLGMVVHVFTLDSYAINAISTIFVPITFGGSVLIGGLYNAYRYSNYTRTLYTGRLLLIKDYQTEFGRLPYPNPWVNIHDRYLFRYYPR